MSQQCTNCANLQAEINRLQAENVALRRRVAQLENGLRRAKRVIQLQRVQLDNVRAACQWFILEAVKEMGKHLPRGTWALWKGRAEAAQHIQGVIGIDYGTGMLAEIASLLGW